jgi:hypothetical protein
LVLAYAIHIVADHFKRVSVDEIGRFDSKKTPECQGVNPILKNPILKNPILKNTIYDMA